MNWDEWQADMLNRLFARQGVIGESGKITERTVRHGRLAAPRPSTYARHTGFVSEARFARNGSEQVIQRTNREVTKKWMNSHGAET